MNSTLFKWQLTACGVLSIILLSEWGFGELSHSHLQDILNKSIAADYPSEPLPSMSLPRQAASNFTNITERPLFIEGRKPLPDVADEHQETAAETGQIDDWQLIGVYNKDKRMVALFRKQNEAKKFLKLYAEQTISGWQLKQIQADRVLLQQGGQERALMLRKPREQSKLLPSGKRPVPPVKPAQPNETPINNNPTENINNDG